ncbi:MAG: ATP-binding protein [Anaerolineales bacterium]|nr:ATP-binding protein [Anaerolineales bacterium]MCB8953468.1 ATP-binding protein [Ardenticatenales bacterium]
MKLVKLSYTEFVGEPQEWKLADCTFGNINLIVGKNATGKTRTLNVIRALADLLAEASELRWREGSYVVDFESENKTISYILEYHEYAVTREELRVNSVMRLKRGRDGAGEIYAAEIGKAIRFRIPVNQVAAFAKRDSIQHPFLEDLYEWGKGLIRYDFGTPLGKDHFAILVKQEEEEEQARMDLRQTQKAVEIFLRGMREYPNGFTKAIIEDLAIIGYQIEDIGVDDVPEMRVRPSIMAPPLGIYVKETDRQGRTFQPSISQGMFRALSVIVQVNYSLLASEPSCILIDDIGEGLDFSRSSALITLLVNRIRNSSTQLIMATNDRFVMNNVPLEYWIIMERQRSECILYNYRNSKRMFDEFELTGLNNFDLFSSNYYLRANGI